MAADRNGSGYDISSQNYFRDLAREIDEDLVPVRKQSVSEARAKLSWQAFEFLLERANIEEQGLPRRLTFKGHVTRAFDGTSFYTPRSDELLEHFSPRNTKAGETHYPYGLLVAGINVFTGQPVKAAVDDYRVSERDLLLRLIDQCAAGDLALLDRGLGGGRTYAAFDARKQFFIHRTKTSGERVAKYVQKFLFSGKRQKKVTITVTDESGGEARIKIRLIRGPKDSEGKPIVFVTNLLSKSHYTWQEIVELYQRRWTVETLYGRVKNLLALEKFHSRSYNGVMQEIFANLLVLSLTALAVAAVVDEDDVDATEQLPSFKNAAESIRRHLFAVVDHRIEGKRREIVEAILAEVRHVMYKIRPGRSYARVSMQPIKSWNLKKSAKIAAFHNGGRR
jgi:hypothetical protein